MSTTEVDSADLETPAAGYPKRFWRAFIGLWWWFFASLFSRMTQYGGLAAVIAGIVYWMFSHGEDSHEVIAATIVFCLNAVVGFGVAVQTAFVSTAFQVFESLHLGRFVFDGILRGIRKPDASNDSAAVLVSEDGKTEPELRTTLTEGAKKFLDGFGFEKRIPRPIRWVAKKAVSIGTWGVVKFVLAIAGKRSIDGANALDVFQLKSRIGERIDKELSSYARTQINRKAWAIMGLAAGLTLIGAGVMYLFVS